MIPEVTGAKLDEQPGGLRGVRACVFAVAALGVLSTVLILLLPDHGSARAARFESSGPREG